MASLETENAQSEEAKELEKTMLKYLEKERVQYVTFIKDYKKTDNTVEVSETLLEQFIDCFDEMKRWESKKTLRQSEYEEKMLKILEKGKRPEMKKVMCEKVSLNQTIEVNESILLNFIDVIENHEWPFLRFGVDKYDQQRPDGFVSRVDAQLGNQAEVDDRRAFEGDRARGVQNKAERSPPKWGRIRCKWRAASRRIRGTVRGHPVRVQYQQSPDVGPELRGVERAGPRV